MEEVCNWFERQTGIQLKGHEKDDKGRNREALERSSTWPYVWIRNRISRMDKERLTAGELKTKYAFIPRGL